jgi:hypothetical protein
MVKYHLKVNDNNNLNMKEVTSICVIIVTLSQQQQ